MYVCMYVCMYVRTYVRMYVYVCMCVCVCVCVCVCDVYVSTQSARVVYTRLRFGFLNRISLVEAQPVVTDWDVSG